MQVKNEEKEEKLEQFQSSSLSFAEQLYEKIRSLSTSISSFVPLRIE